MHTHKNTHTQTQTHAVWLDASGKNAVERPFLRIWMVDFTHNTKHHLWICLNDCGWCIDIQKMELNVHENTIRLILYTLSHSLSPSCFNSLSFFSSSNFPFLIKFFFEFFLQNNICWIEIRKFFMNFPHTHTFCARIFQRMWVCKCEYVRLCVWKRIEHTKYSVIHISLITTTH